MINGKGANNRLKNYVKGANNYKNNFGKGANYDIIHSSNAWRFIYGTNCFAKIDRME